MIQRRDGSCQKTLGSRNEFELRSSDGISRELRPGPTAIDARGEVLCLLLVAVAGVDRDHRRGVRFRPSPTCSAASKTALPEKIMMPSSSREGRPAGAPAHEVAADGVPPAHVSPAVSLGVVLVERGDTRRRGKRAHSDR